MGCLKGWMERFDRMSFEEMSAEYTTPCRLCPRSCGVVRARQRGYCQAGDQLRIYRYGPHFGEEPPLVGEKGSGAIFFSHCTLRCIYCQNHPWSQGGAGDEMSVEALAQIMRELAQQGCHNWNLVSPTPWLPLIRKAHQMVLKTGVSLPFVYNTSGYESPSTLQAYAELADVALVDLRYASAWTALEGSDAGNYVQQARETIEWFWEHLGPLQLDAQGVAQRGVICRLLVLPGRSDEAVESLAWLANHLGTEVHLSVMSQYTPVYRAENLPTWNRQVTAEEYAAVQAAVESFGFENGWVQPVDEQSKEDLLGQNMPAGQGTVGQMKMKDRE